MGTFDNLLELKNIFCNIDKKKLESLAFSTSHVPVSYSNYYGENEKVISLTLLDYLVFYDSINDVMRKMFDKEHLQKSSTKIVHEQMDEFFNKVLQQCHEHKNMIEYAHNLGEEYESVFVEEFKEMKEQLLDDMLNCSTCLYESLQSSFFEYSDSLIDDLSVQDYVRCYRWSWHPSRSNSSEIVLIKFFNNHLSTTLFNSLVEF